MLHTLQPSAFIARHALDSTCKCPDCERPFLYGDGVVSLSHYLDAETDDVRQGLMCFCSTACLLRWEPHTLMGLMQ